MTIRTVARPLACSVPGCTRNWTVNFGRAYCGEHDPGLTGREPVLRQSSLQHMPTLREAVRPFAEPVERDGDAA